MKSNEPPAQHHDEPKDSGRRALLAKLLAAASAGLAALGLGASVARRRAPREQELNEADLYSPHDLAG